jgi:hypothetical protein
MSPLVNWVRRSLLSFWEFDKAEIFVWPPLYSCTPVLLYSCTPVLLYSCPPPLAPNDRLLDGPFFQS